MSDLRSVPVANVQANIVALRAVNQESEKYISLRDSVGRFGLLNPISVREKTVEVDGETHHYFEVLDGLHRYTACVDNNFDSIDVTVLSMSESDALLAQIVANVMKVETRPVEYTKQLQKIIGANPTWTIVDLANKLSLSPSWLNQRFGLLKLDPAVQELTDSGEINVSNAIVLAKLPPTEQLNFIDSAITMATTEFGPLVQDRVTEIKKAHAEGRKPGEAVFKALAKPRKKSELEDELNGGNVLAAIAESCDTKAQAAYEALKWVLQLDHASVSVAEAAYNEKKDRVETEKKKRAADRAKTKAEEAAQAAAKAQAEFASVN
jgi:ParB/RepB/Spo0J family partition protein